MNNDNLDSKKHYHEIAKIQRFLEEKLLHEAKMISKPDYSGFKNKTNLLRKQKSEFLAKTEDSLDAILNLMEGLKRPTGSEFYKILKSKYTDKGYESNKKKFEQKLFDEFQGISYRIFTKELILRMVQCMFVTPPHGQKLELEKRIREVTLANILLKAALSVLRHNLDTTYHSFLVQDFDRAQQLSDAILGELKRDH